MVDQAVDSRRCGHWIFENADPVTEDQVARDHNALSFVPFSKESEKDFHFIAALLNVPNVIKNDGVVRIKRSKLAFET